MSSKYYPNAGSLNSVRNVLTQAGDAINDPLKELGKHGIPEVAAAAGGAVAGGAVGVGAVAASGSVAGLSAAGVTSGLASLGGLVGGGMAVGIAVAAAPAAILAVAAYAGVHYWNSRRLKQAKDALLKEALQKQNAIIEQLKDKAKLSEDRISTLERLNILLQEIIHGLECDLGSRAA